MSLELRAKAFKTEHSGRLNVEVDLFIVDMAQSKYLLEDIQFTAQLRYSGGDIAKEISGNDFFGNSNGGFKILFGNLPDYPYRDVVITLTSPQLSTIAVDLEYVEVTRNVGATLVEHAQQLAI